MVISIRKGKLKDVKEILYLLNSSPKLHTSKKKNDYDLKFVKSVILDNKTSLVLIAQEDEEIAGFLIALFWPKIHEAFTLDLFVKPKFRGKGIATLLNKNYENILKQNKYRYITSFVLTDNIVMKNFKSKLKYNKGKKFFCYTKELKW